MKGLIRNHDFSNIKVGQKIPRKLKKGLKDVTLEVPVENPFDFKTYEDENGVWRVKGNMTFNIKSSGPETKWKRMARGLVRRSYRNFIMESIRKSIACNKTK